MKKYEKNNHFTTGNAVNDEFDHLFDPDDNLYNDTNSTRECLTTNKKTSKIKNAKNYKIKRNYENYDENT